MKIIPKVGWCEEPFLGISLHPVPHPTKEQIRFVKSQAAHAGQNFLQIRQLLQRGGSVAFGLLLPEDVDRIGARLQELGLLYSIEKQRVYRTKNP
jgi:hypothetical protein